MQEKEQSESFKTDFSHMLPNCLCKICTAFDALLDNQKKSQIDFKTFGQNFFGHVLYYVCLINQEGSY